MYPDYLVHFNPNHDPKNGRFTFSRKDQKANYKYIKEAKSYTETENRARDAVSRFSNKYQDLVKQKIDSIDSFEKLSAFRSKDLEELGINEEIDAFLGKYANKTFDKRMNQSYRDLLRRLSFNEAYNQAQSKLLDDEKTTKKRIKEFNKEHNLLSMDGGYKKYLTNPEFKKRADAAATLGLKTLRNLDGKNTDIDNPNDDGWKKWFLFEDQTIGYPTISDLVIQGYSKEKILKTIGTINDIRLRTGDDEGISLYDEIPGSFELEESNNHMYSNTDFIDEAIKIKGG